MIIVGIKNLNTKTKNEAIEETKPKIKDERKVIARPKEFHLSDLHSYMNSYRAQNVQGKNSLQPQK